MRVRDDRVTSSLSARVFSWSGAALFVGSLAYFLFAYLTTFGNPATGSQSLMPITTNVALFTVFAVHHSLFAREYVRQWIANHVAPIVERSLYVWVASFLLIAVCVLWQPVPGEAWSVNGKGLWVLRVLQVGAIWLTLQSAALLDARQLAGLRAAQSDVVTFKTRGPYGWVRHPIYTGWFLLVFTVSPMTMTRLVFAVVSCVYLLIAIPFEERSMRALSRDEYERYVDQVRWRLVPGVY